MIDARARVGRLLTTHILLFLLLFARRPESLTHAQFWAEDGAVFFAEQLRFGFLQALSSTYAGYYLVVPRLIAGAAGHLPAKDVPFAYNLAALVLASVCCGLFTWPIFRNLIASDELRIAACFVAAAAVYGGNEVIADICNLQWFFLIAALLLTCYQEPHRAKPPWIHTLLALTNLLIALTAPLVLILIPWLLWQAVKNRSWGRLPPLCMLAGSFFEVFTFLRSSEPHGLFQSTTWSSLFVAVVGTAVSRAVLVTLLGHKYLLRGAGVLVVSKFLAALVLLSVGLTLLYSSMANRQRKVLTIGLYLSLSCIAIIMLGRNLANSFTDPSGFRYLPGERYFFMPAFVFVFLAAFCIDNLLRTRSSSLKIVTLLIIFSYGGAKNFPAPHFTDLHWDQYARSIDDWAQRHNRGEHVARLIVPINPVPFNLILE